MTVRRRPPVVVLGAMAQMPWAGVVWQTLHYLVGLERLGFEPWYVEAHAVAPRRFIRDRSDDGTAAAAAFLDRVLRRFGFGRRWALHALHADGRCVGLAESRLRELYAEAELVINLHGATVPRAEHLAARRLVCVATDPVQMELELHQGAPATVEFFRAHHAVFSFGENLGQPGCLLPVTAGFPILPTRQPVVLDLWEGWAGAERETFTTVANWRQERDLRFAGETYQWSKDREFLKLLDLPRRTPQVLELALTRCPEEQRRLLVEHGWRVRDALEVSGDLDTYRDYVASSRGELTVAKDQNIRLRSGWFSDRSATYLAAGRPVVTQDTGFGSVLPTGEGLFAFATAEEAAAALAEIAADYPRHRRGAREVARACFAHDVVLGDLLAGAEVELPRQPRRRAGATPARVMLVAHRFPPDAVGGVERYTEKVAAALAAAGREVTVVSRRPGPGPLRREVELLPSGVTVHRIAGAHSGRDRFLAGAAAREALFRAALTEAAPDVVHVNHLLDLSPRVLELARGSGAAVVLTLHDYYFACDRVVLTTVRGESCSGPRGGLACAARCFPEQAHAPARWALRTAYFRRLLDIPHRLACPSRFVADYFAAQGADPDRLRVVSNGIWVPQGDSTSGSWPTPAERGRLALAFLGPLLPHKGLQVVLAALEQAGLQAIDLTTFGPVDDATAALGLYARADAIPGLRFRMYGEYQPEELTVLLADVDAVVVPSQWPETFCLVAREALARGIPALVARMGALPDGVADGVNGLVFAHDRPDELAAILRRLADEGGLVQRLRAGARATPVPTLADHVKALEQVYREAADAAAAVPARPLAEADELAAFATALADVGFGDATALPTPAAFSSIDGDRAAEPSDRGPASRVPSRAADTAAPASEVSWS